MAAANGEPVPTGNHDVADEEPSEHTPLLHRPEDRPSDQSQPQRERSAESLLRTLSDGKSPRRRWPSLLALLILCLVVVLIIVFAFVAPTAVEQYAAQAMVFEPSSLSIAGFTSTGVRARIQGNFRMDAGRVQKKPIRDLGIFGTWIVREVESGTSDVEVSLPEYGNVVLGTAHVPGIKVDVRNGHSTHVDVVTDLEPGDKDGIRRIAKDWIDGRLGQLRVLGTATVPLKTGIFKLGSQKIRHELLFANNGIPSIPAYDIQSLIFQETEIAGDKVMEADVSLLVANKYPFKFDVPQLGFEILLDNCLKSDPYIEVAQAVTKTIHVRPKDNVEVNVTGYVHELPPRLIQSCPGSKVSPLDLFLGKYMNGENNTIYVRGSEAPDSDTPAWVSDLISGITVPVPLPGRSFGHLIRNFSLEDTHFGLPDPFADPHAPESNPQITATVIALVAIPQEMNFSVAAHRVRAEADVFYKGSKLGELDLSKWQQANSTRVEGSEDGEGPSLLVSSHIEQAPLNITDSALFTEVVQDLLFGDKSVMMTIKAKVDVEVETALGQFKIRNIPAEGEVSVQPISSRPGIGKPTSLNASIADLRILSTTASSLTLGAYVNFTNPTPYSATIPYVNIHLLKNSSLLGHATARDLVVRPGRNELLFVSAVYSPLDLGGQEARVVGREMLSQYISGYNTTLSLRTHEGTIPSRPDLGRALSKFEIDIPAPRLKPPPNPDDGNQPDDGKAHFLRDTTFHLITSTATFTLFSPLRHTSLVVETINATALYPRSSEDNGDPDHGDGDDDDDDDPIEEDPVGHIFYDRPFAVPPVDSHGRGFQTPKLPVDWSLGSVGYDAVRKALGGQLRLSAFARVGVRIGNWREEIWYKGKGIGAKIRL